MNGPPPVSFGLLGCPIHCADRTGRIGSVPKDPLSELRFPPEVVGPSVPVSTLSVGVGPPVSSVPSLGPGPELEVGSDPTSVPSGAAAVSLVSPGEGALPDLDEQAPKRRVVTTRDREMRDMRTSSDA